MKETCPDIVNILKDNYVIEFSRLTDDHNDNQLQKSLISRMKQFILELGKIDF